MRGKVRTIVITDGDKVAKRAVEEAGEKLNLRTISASSGNPTPLNGEELVALIKQVPFDPVLVMVDDCGNPNIGPGEHVLQYLGSHPDIDLLGVVAVAANVERVKGVKVDCCIDQAGNLIDLPVDKNGVPESAGHEFVKGDTVDILNTMSVPVIIGIGDIGKQCGRDSVYCGSKVTTRAIQEILVRGGIYGQTSD